MKDLFKKLFLFCTVFALGFALVSCGDSTGEEDKDEDTDYISVEDYREYIKIDLAEDVRVVEGEVSDAVFAEIKKEQAAGEKAMDDAKNIKDVKKAYEECAAKIAAEIPYANGVQSFLSASNADKTEIAGVLEAYAVRNGITGISLFENGGYNMYNERVTLGTETYIIGYGFGTLAEGSLTADLATENTAAWKRYYHTLNASDPGTVNYLNDQGSEVGDFYGYFGASFFTTFMNETKDGYKWVPELAKSMPEAVDAEEGSETAKVWRFPVRTGKDGLKYNTNSAIASRAAFNGRDVELEDYITPFKLLLTKSNNLYRGSELAANKTAPIKGAKAYYDATGSGPADFSEVGVKVYEEDGKEYFEVEFTTPLTQFYAMYYISSSLYMPVPQEFLDLTTVPYYLGYNEDKSEGPVDNSLSLGAYTLERWDSEQQVVYKKNPYYVFADSKYQIAGVHINILPAMAEDTEASFKEFMAGKTDACGLPQTQLEQYKNDPRTRQSRGDSNFKLNVNATTKETWEYFFGENGTVCQTPKASYWDVEPALGNSHFVKAISYAINRVEFADARGSIGTVDYLAPNYMADPVEGIAYADTAAHKKAVEGLLADTEVGYSLELARQYFSVALAELEADGAYTPGTEEDPTIVELEIAWMYPTHEKLYHTEIKQYLEEAFNHPSVSGGRYKLDVKFWVGAAWSDVYYNKLMVGQYDLGFGSISGNPLDILGFLNVLSSDPSISGEFTLNWGTDTNDPDSAVLAYQGYRWSYDALWSAATGQAIVEEGANKPAFTGELASQEVQADGSVVSVINIDITLPAQTEFAVDDVVMCWYAGDYKEESVMAYTAVVNENGSVAITVTCPADLVAAYPSDMGFDVYYTMKIDGNGSSTYYSVYGSYPEAE